MTTADVHILTLPSTNQDWLAQCLESLEGQPVNIHMLSGVEGHVGKARKAAFPVGDSPYIAIVDPDDIVMPKAIQKCIDTLEEDPAASMAYTGEARISERGVLLSDWGREMYEPFFNTKYEPLRAHHLSVIRRSAMPEDLSFLDNYPIAGEQALKKKLHRQGRFAFVDICGYQWRRHPGNVSSKPELGNDYSRAITSQYRKIKQVMSCH